MPRQLMQRLRLTGTAEQHSGRSGLVQATLYDPEQGIERTC